MTSPEKGELSLPLPPPAAQGMTDRLSMSRSSIFYY